MSRARRKPDCHPERKHAAHGYCTRCYAVLYHAEHRKSGAGKQAGTLWPQKIARVPVKGWGYAYWDVPF